MAVRYKKYKNKGQSLIEYIIIVGVVMTAVYYMAPALKRGTQSVIKATADQLAPQLNSEQDFDVSTAHLDNQMASSKVSSNKMVYGSAAGIRTVVKEASESVTNTITNGGIN